MKCSVVLVAALTTVAAVLTGCGDGTHAADQTGISIVTSTNVYGAIAGAVAGDAAEVTSIITSAAQDPHSYEATAQDRLAVARADLVVMNGGGYDAFMQTLLDANDTKTPSVNASKVSGLIPTERKEGDPAHENGPEDHHHIEGFNEHLWYDLTTAAKVARQIADELGELDPANAKSYAQNAETFAAKVGDLKKRAAAIAAEHEREGVGLTELVPAYLLKATGLRNRTPAAFSEAVEEGIDVSPAILRDTLDIVTSGDIVLLAYNAQTAGPVTQKVRAAAEKAGVPVVEFTETLPDGQNYVEWMTANLAAIESAVTA